MSYEEWKKELRAVPPKEQRERDRKARNRQLWHQHAITESYIDRLLESSGPIQEWEREFLAALVDGNAWQRFEAKERLLRA